MRGGGGRDDEYGGGAEECDQSEYARRESGDNYYDQSQRNEYKLEVIEICPSLALLPHKTS